MAVDTRTSSGSATGAPVGLADGCAGPGDALGEALGVALVVDAGARGALSGSDEHAASVANVVTATTAAGTRTMPRFNSIGNNPRVPAVGTIVQT